DQPARRPDLRQLSERGGALGLRRALFFGALCFSARFVFRRARFAARLFHRAFVSQRSCLVALLFYGALACALLSARAFPRRQKTFCDASVTSDASLGPMKIYTRTGDDGETGLFGGARVKKNHL